MHSDTSKLFGDGDTLPSLQSRDAERHRGAIIIVALIQPMQVRLILLIMATKAYDLSLAEALWYEFKPLGIDVLGFSPQVPIHLACEEECRLCQRVRLLRESC